MYGQPLTSAVIKEGERLHAALKSVSYDGCHSWSKQVCEHIAPLSLKIKKLKKEKNAVILAHSYVTPDIVYGIADYRGVSYSLSKWASESKADIIIFAGVVFMAETAKLLNPKARVFIPDPLSGCSLSEAIQAKHVRELKAEHPGVPVVCYINSSADVKAESDICVTSSNVYKIVANLPNEKVIFIPDQLMAENIRGYLLKNNIKKEIITRPGTCIVHDQFTAEQIAYEKSKVKDLAIVSHPECPPDVTAASDFVGSTSAMMEFVKTTNHDHYLLLTECGLVSRLQSENPEKKFVMSCRLCPYMKRNSMQKVHDVLESMDPAKEVHVSADVAKKALASIEKMFELAEA